MDEIGLDCEKIITGYKEDLETIDKYNAVLKQMTAGFEYGLHLQRVVIWDEYLGRALRWKNIGCEGDYIDGIKWLRRNEWKFGPAYRHFIH